MAMRADIKAGNAFPDYKLPDHTGRPRRLSEIQASDPMVIVLAREPTRPRTSASMRAWYSCGAR
jgi:hypothetical protein